MPVSAVLAVARPEMQQLVFFSEASRSNEEFLLSWQLNPPPHTQTLLEPRWPRGVHTDQHLVWWEICIENGRRNWTEFRAFQYSLRLPFDTLWSTLLRLESGYCQREDGISESPALFLCWAGKPLCVGVQLLFESGAVLVYNLCSCVLPVLRREIILLDLPHRALLLLKVWCVCTRRLEKYFVLLGWDFHPKDPGIVCADQCCVCEMQWGWSFGRLVLQLVWVVLVFFPSVFSLISAANASGILQMSTTDYLNEWKTRKQMSRMKSKSRQPEHIFFQWAIACRVVEQEAPE